MVVLLSNITTIGNNCFLFVFICVRYYVISRLRNLTTLDHTPVSEQERSESLKLYGNLTQKVAREENEAQRINQLKQQKKDQRLQRRKEVICHFN